MLYDPCHARIKSRLQSRPNYFQRNFLLTPSTIFLLAIGCIYIICYTLYPKFTCIEPSPNHLLTTLMSIVQSPRRLLKTVLSARTPFKQGMHIRSKLSKLWSQRKGLLWDFVQWHAGSTTAMQSTASNVEGTQLACELDLGRINIVSDRPGVHI